MRFITEFELPRNIDTKLLEFMIPDKRHIRETCIGKDVGRSFGWKETEFINSEGQAYVRHTLEIEAFPMDKWIEFKNKLLDEIRQSAIHSIPISPFKILEMIKELESFGKPSEDTISNHQSNK